MNADPQTQLKPVLGTGALVFFGLAYLAPMVVFTVFGIATIATKSHMPTAYAVTTCAMLFTAISYALLVRDHPSAGSAYTYAKRAFGSKIGFITGWILLLDYILLPAINYLVMGIYINAQFSDFPQFAVILAAISIVTILNIVGISFVRSASMLLVLVQFAFCGVFLALVLVNVQPESGLFAPFYSAEFQWDAILAGAAILCLSFLGFDAVSTLSEEARDPQRSVPRAIILTTVIGGFLFIILSFAATHVLPDWRAVEEPDAAGLQIMRALGGKLFVSGFLAAYLVGAFASAIASQASVSRVLYAMGRDHVLPHSVFGVLSARFQTPARATLVVAAVSLGVIFVTLDLLASIISFGALFAFSLVNLAAIKRFIFEQKRGRGGDLILYGVTPLIGFILTIWLWFSLSQIALIVGLSWLVIGIVYMAARGEKALSDKNDISDPAAVE